MNLLILGCGTIIQQGRAMNGSGYLLDRKVLIDSGPGIWKALHHHQIAIAEIDYIFFSHFHVDHTSDLAPILQERYLTPESKKRPLTIAGPAGLSEWFGNLTNLIGKWSAEMDINLIELFDLPLDIGDYKVRSMSTSHSDNSICYRIEKDGISFFYSGDADYDEGFRTIATGCNLGLIEASNTEETKLSGHLTPELAGRIAAEASLGKLILTHMYPEVKQTDPLREAGRRFKGEVIIAEEGMELIF